MQEPATHLDHGGAGAVSGHAAPRVAVVLAAGEGSRLNAGATDTPKPLVRLVGLPLIDRAIRTLLAAGLDEVIVVYGAHPEVGSHCQRVFGDTGRVRVVEARRWREGNGATLSAARKYLSAEPTFMAVAADSIFDAEAISVLSAAQPPAVLVAAGDMPGVDLVEATHVLVGPGAAGEVVEAIGKGLGRPGVAEANGSNRAIAVETGLQLLTPGVFEAQAEAESAGDASLSGAIRRLAEVREVAAVPLPVGSPWQDVDTPSDLAWARKKLLRSLRSPKDGPIARYLNRPVSLAITRALAGTRIVPDAVSLIAFGVAMAAAGLIAFGGLAAIIGGILAQAASVIDGVDGELARAKFKASAAGEFLDGVLDRVADVSLIAALGVCSIAAGYPASQVVALTAFAAGGALLSMATKDKALLAFARAGRRGRAELLADAEKLRRQGEVVAGWMMAGRDGRLLAIAISAIFGIPLAGLAFIAMTSLSGAVLRTGLARRYLRWL